MKPLFLLLSLAACLLPARADEYVVPLDLARHAAGEKPVHLTAAGEGTWEWELPAGKPETLLFDLEAAGIDPTRFDEIRFEIKSTVSQVRTHWNLHGHLEDGQLSSWYLKFKTPVGEWREGRYSLHLDDDGLFISKPTNPEKFTKWLKITLSPRILGFPGEPKRRHALIRNVRFVRHRVSADFRLDEAEYREDAAEIAYVYPLHLTNHTDQPQTAQLNPDAAGRLHYFQAEAPETVELQPGERKVVPIRLSMPRHEAMARAPLYAEPAFVEVRLPDMPDGDVAPLKGYRRWPMWAAVPVFNVHSWTPATFQARLAARQQLIPGIAAWREKVLEDAARALAHDWPIPDFGPPLHNLSYRCQECKNWLKPESPTALHRHVCPTCKKVWDHDENMDRAYLLNYHSARARNVRDLARAWLLTGEEQYAVGARDLLLKYAEGYPKMPIRGTRSTAGSARLGFSTLHESYVIPIFAQGYDDLRAAPVLDETARGQIEGFLRQAGETLVRHSVEYGNQQSEHLRAYGTAGLATRFWPLAAEAIHGEFGYHEVVEYGFSEDGIAPEAGAYHLASFNALQHLAQFGYPLGLNLYTPRFKRVFDGSIAAGLSGATSYEVAYRVYREPAYVPRLQPRDAQRLKDETVLLGAIGLPDVEAMPVRSVHLTGAGYVFLRRGHAGDFREIRINYLKQFDRTERDRLTTFFFRNGRQVDSTVGRIGYASPHSHWMYHPAAHNCIVIDGETQEADRGRLIAFDDTPAAPVAVVASDPERPFYDGVEQVRCVALLGDAYVVFDRVTCDRPRTIDRYQYGKGTAKFRFKGEAPVEDLPAIPAHGDFQQLSGGAAGQDLRVDYGENLTMRLVSDGELAVYLAVTHAGYQARPAEVTFARRADAQAATFLAAFTDEKKAKPPALRILRTEPNDLAFEVKDKDTTWTVTIQPEAGKVTVATE